MSVPAWRSARSREPAPPAPAAAHADAPSIQSLSTCSGRSRRCAGARASHRSRARHRGGDSAVEAARRHQIEIPHCKTQEIRWARDTRCPNCSSQSSEALNIDVGPTEPHENTTQNTTQNTSQASGAVFRPHTILYQSQRPESSHPRPLQSSSRPFRPPLEGPWDPRRPPLVPAW